MRSARCLRSPMSVRPPPSADDPALFDANHSHVLSGSPLRFQFELHMMSRFAVRGKTLRGGERCPGRGEDDPVSPDLTDPLCRDDAIIAEEPSTPHDYVGDAMRLAVDKHAVKHAGQSPLTLNRRVAPKAYGRFRSSPYRIPALPSRQYMVAPM